MNLIVPHNPPVPTPGQLPTTGGGGGKQQDDTTFDDVMSGVPTKGLPSPIEDHSPPPVLDDSDSDDQAAVPLLRPMRWKGNRGTTADATGPDAGTGVPPLPIQPDLRAVVPAVALSGGWSRPIVTPDDAGAQLVQSSSTTPDGISGISAGDASVSNPSSGSYPIMSSRLAPMPVADPGGTTADGSTAVRLPVGTSLSADGSVAITVPADASVPVASSAEVIAGPTVQLPPPGATGNQSAASETAAEKPRNTGPLSSLTAVMSNYLTPMPFLSSDPVVAGPTDPIPSPVTAAVLPSAPAGTPDTNPDSASVEQTGNPQAVNVDPVKVEPAENDSSIALTQTVLTTRMPNMATAAPILKDARADANSLSASGSASGSADALPTSAPVSVPKGDDAVLSRGVDPGTKGSPEVAPAQTTATTLNPPAEVSAPFQTDEAKIAVSTAHDIPRVRDSKMLGLQIPIVKPVKQNCSDDGTVVAKDAEVVNATLPDSEKATETSPSPKRAGGYSTGLASSGRTGASATTGRHILTDLPVSGVTEPATTAALVTTAPVPEPTAARQAVKVETLLQNALSAGESLRPNGQDSMEMRVRLGGSGSEDVTVRMQVVNDRMQVTFQTNSPEMRKALEQGWGQFSTTAAHTSTLGLAAPRFETPPTSAVPQGQETDAQGFSFDQQNPHRQDPSATLFEDGAATTNSRRTGLASANTNSPATTNQATTRRWTGWA